MLFPLLLGACAADDPESGATPDPSTESVSQPVPEIALEDRLVVDLEIAEGPDRLVAAFGSLWVRRDNQTVLRLDPATNEVIGEIDLARGLCQGFGLGLGRIWSCAADHLVAIDPRNEKVVLRSKDEMNARQGSIGVGAGSAWVLTEEDLGATLLRIDSRSGRTVSRVDLGYLCANVAFGFDRAWVACPIDGLVLAIDPANDEIVDEIGDVPGAREIAIGPDHLWVGTEHESGGIARVDPNTGEVTIAANAPDPGTQGNMFASEDGVWIRSEQDFIVKVSPDAEVVERITSDVVDGGAVLAAFGSLWTTAYDLNRLIRLDL